MKKYCFLLIWLLLPVVAYPQNDTAKDGRVPVTDSVKAEVLSANTQLLQRYDSLRKIDSIQRALLEEELASLKTTDNLKKQDLLVELDRIKAQENERIALQKARVDSLKQVVTGYPVSPFYDTVFYVYTSLGPFSAATRAANIAKAIKVMEEDILFHEDSISIFNSGQTVDLSYRGSVVLSVADADALWMGMSKVQLAGEYKASIAKSITDHRKATNLQTLLKEAGLGLLVILIAILVIKYLGRGFKLLRVAVRNGRDKWIKGIRVKGYELFSVQQELNAIYFVLNIIRWLLIILVVYLMLLILFGIFPWTKTLSGTLLGYVINPVKAIARTVWNYIPNLVTIAVIIFIFRYVFKALKYFTKEVTKGALVIPGFYPEWAAPTYQIVRVLVFAFMLIVIFPLLPGSESAVFRGVSVFLGVLFTFSSSGSLSNIFAGLVLTYTRAFKPGDFVKIGNAEGEIIEKTLLVTRIRTIKNEEVTIPNSAVMNGHTVNYSSASQDAGLIVHTTVAIGYDAPWQHVHELLISAALDTNYVLPEPKPFVLQTALNDFTVSYQVNAYTRQPNLQPEIYTSLHQNIQDKFNAAGIEILSTTYHSLRDGNRTTIPADYIPPGYTTPSFRVNSTGIDGKK